MMVSEHLQNRKVLAGQQLDSGGIDIFQVRSEKRSMFVLCLRNKGLIPEKKCGRGSSEITRILDTQTCCDIDALNCKEVPSGLECSLYRFLRAVV